MDLGPVHVQTHPLHPLTICKWTYKFRTCIFYYEVPLCQNYVHLHIVDWTCNKKICLCLFYFELYFSCDKTILKIRLSMSIAHLRKHFSASLLRLFAIPVIWLFCFACHPYVSSNCVVMNVILMWCSPCHLTVLLCMLTSCLGLSSSSFAHCLLQWQQGCLTATGIPFATSTSSSFLRVVTV